MSRAIELIEYLISVEQQNCEALKQMDSDGADKVLIEHFADQANKKVAALAKARDLVKEELEAAAAAAPAASA